MKNQARDQLRELLQQKVKAVSELAVREQGNIPPDLIKDISNFKQLVELHQSVTPPSPRKRWVVPLVLITTLIITSALLFVHLPDARVDLDLVTSTLAFTVDEPQDLATTVRVLSISASGLERIDMSGLDEPGRLVASNRGGTDSIRLSLPRDGKGTITLEKIQLPARSRVTLETLDGSNRFRVAWKLPRNESPRPLSISVLGEVQVGLSASPPKVLRLNTPTGLEMIPGSDVVLELDLPENSELAIEPQLPVSMLSFATVHELVGAESSARQVSTIRSGTVFIQSLNGQRYDLRAGERLRFSDSKGEMQKTALRPNAITVQYEGKVWGMSAGSHEYPTSLMPSLLEWLRARHGLSLLWGSTLYVTGMLMVVLRWFRMVD